MSKIWIKDGTVLTKGSSTTTALPNGPASGVYEIHLSMSGFYLMEISENFHFDDKVYGLCEDFINYVIKTYNNTSGNLGILLNGTKGTGKTFTAKEICNRLGLPVIIVKSMGDSDSKMIEWLSGQINFDCIFFFDEYEKEFEDSSEILSFMDGVYNSPYRKFFILTTNSLNINSNLIGRPSRIRYCKTFDNLSENVCREILNDILVDKSAIDSIIALTNQMSIITIDLIKQLANEINIHGIQSIDTIKEIFNIEFASYTYYYIQFGVNDITNLNKNDIDKITQEILSYKEVINKPFSERTEKDNNILREVMNKYEIERTSSTDSNKLETLKVGSTFFAEKVLYVDLKHKVVMTAYQGRIYVYHIINSFSNSVKSNLSLAL